MEVRVRYSCLLITVLVNCNCLNSKSSLDMVHAAMCEDSRVPQNHVVNDDHQVWTKGNVPYVFSNNLGLSQRNALLRGMEDIEDHTCVTFHYVDSRNIPDHLIVFIASEERFPEIIGVDKGSLYQTVRLNKYEFTQHKVLRKLYQTLGRGLEHQREDRDCYVSVNWENIIPGKIESFEILNYGFTSQGLPYDYDSVMHYREMEFTKNGFPTIVPTVKDAKLTGHGSYFDRLHINLLYCGATRLIVRNVTVTSSNNSITLSWSVPKFLPQFYLIKYKCQFGRHGTVYRSDLQVVHQLETYLVMDYLRPDSTCTINFRAVYNHASIDHGLDFTKETTLSRCKPGKPTGLRGSMTQSNIILRWDPPTTGPKAPSYRVRFVFSTKKVYNAFVTKPEITVSNPHSEASVLIGVSAVSMRDVKGVPQFIRLTMLPEDDPVNRGNTTIENL